MTYTNLYDCCSIYKGKNAGAIYDFEKGLYVSLPLDFCNIFDKKNISFDYEIKHYKSSSKIILQKILNFLIVNGFMYQTVELKVDEHRIEEYHSPFEIESLIIDFKDSKRAIFFFENFFLFPDVESVQIRIFKSPDYNDFISLLNYLKIFSSQSIELIIVHIGSIIVDDYLRIIMSNPHISKLIVMNHTQKKILYDNKLFILTDIMINEKSCGKISEKLFQINKRTEITSKKCNSCLNRKISIDQNGDIRNCPSMPESYGNIKDTTLEEAINKPGFKKYWNITKDDIEVCRDCEFRYICTDCRAYTERTKFSDEGLDLSKPLKCGYNPYTNEWAEWSTNPLKEKAIEYYGMKEIIENDKK